MASTLENFRITLMLVQLEQKETTQYRIFNSPALVPSG